MHQNQKEAILALVRIRYDSKDFMDNYLLPYMDFFDCADAFTEFQCERLEGKRRYISLIGSLLVADENAKVFADIYGFEEDDNDTWIYADTLIVLSRLSLFDIKQILISPMIYFRVKSVR